MNFPSQKFRTFRTGNNRNFEVSLLPVGKPDVSDLLGLYALHSVGAGLELGKCLTR